MKKKKRTMKMKTKTQRKAQTRTKTQTSITIVTTSVDATSTTGTIRPLRSVVSYLGAFTGVECWTCTCSILALIYAFFTGI